MTDRDARLVVSVADRLARQPKTFQGTPMQEAARLLNKPVPTAEDLRAIKKRGVGRPRRGVLQAPHDFAILVLYFESVHKKKHSTKAAMEAWHRGLSATRLPPTRRLIQEALRRVRSWGMHDIQLAAEFVRVKYRLKLFR